MDSSWQIGVDFGLVPGVMLVSEGIRKVWDGRHCDAWHAVIDEPTFADAILDRLVHTAYRLDLDGPSMRKLKAGAETPQARP